ncbi:MAG: flagellar hook-basal body complex protein [Rickettsiales bacterium]
MSLYGALFSGVSGLRAQSSKIGVISDNISNVNTVGYKGGSGLFQSLVTNSGSSSSYSPGGVLAGTRQLISQQGLLQSTNSPTDIAISGGGFFTVNSNADQSGQVFYTRAGSFRQDSTGNFRNAAGFFLQAWPLDREGRLPGEPGNLNTTSAANLSSLRTVNVQNLTGVAASTSSVAIGANLSSSQSVFPGSSATTTMDALHTVNFGISSSTIIVPDDPSSPVNSLARGDKFTISTGGGVNYTYRYGGFTFSRNAATAANGDNDQSLLAGNTTVSDATTLAATPYSTTLGSPVVTITQANHGLNTGDSVTLAGNTDAVNFTDANDINGDFIITKVDDDTFTVRMAVNAAATDATGGAGTITSTSRVFSVTAGSNTVQVRQVDHGLSSGAVVSLSGNTDAIAGIPSGDLNGDFVITVIDDDHYTFTAATAATAATLAATPYATTLGSPVVTVTQTAHGYTVGEAVTLSGNTDAVNFASANDINGTFIIESVTANTYTVRMAVNAAATDATAGAGTITTLDQDGSAGTVVSTTRPFAGNILDAQSPTQPFLGTTGVAGYTPAGLTFQITTVTSGTVTFTYTSSSPNAQLGQFNNLNNLADAISAANGLTARVVDNQLYVGAVDANEAITFTNGSTIGTSGPPVQAGIDWVRELGLENKAVGVDRFSTLEGLASLVNASAGVTASVENALANAALRINVDDPLDTISFSDLPVSAALPTTALVADAIGTTAGSSVVTITHAAAHGFTTGDIIDLAGLTGGPYNGIPASAFNGNSFEITVTSPTTYTINLGTGNEATLTGSTGNNGGVNEMVVTPPNNNGSVLAELGLVDSLGGGLFTPQTTGALGPAYDPTDSTKNMASGAIPAQFSRPIRVFDSLGTGHDLSVNFIKIGINTWATEVFALPASDITTALPDGQLTSGTIVFNGDGSLRSLSSGLSADISVSWTNGAEASTIAFDWGTQGQPFGTPGATNIGLSDGLSQFDSAYRVNFVNQNGAPVGELSSVAIDENGFIIASYSNGETQRLFKIPLADFANPDQLLSTSGNVFAETSESGAVNLAEAGTSGVGEVVSSSLEQSNVELADQLTDMIVAQRAYQANTKMIQTSDQLLEELNRIIQ